MPNPEKNKDLFLKWMLRIRREPEDVNKNTRVCSEHFADDDFEPNDIFNSRRMEAPKRVWIRLKKDAIPNTDRETGEMTVYWPGKGSVPRPGRKRVRYMDGYIEDMVQEDDETVQSPHEKEDEALDPPLEEESSNEIKSDPDGNVSERVLDDGRDSKGVQCTTSPSISSTEANLSSTDRHD